MTEPSALQQHAQRLLNRFIRQSGARRSAVRLRRGVRPTRRQPRSTTSHVDNMLRAAANRVHEPRLQLDIRLLRWLLPRAAALMSENSHLSSDEIQTLIHQQIMEFSFIDECGDNVLDDNVFSQIDHQVELIMRILHHARRKADNECTWGDLPSTPMMFG